MRIPLVRKGDDATPIAWWEWLFLPALFLAMFVIALWSLPYFWLYPEGTLRPADVEGPEEERQRLEAYRAYRRRVGLWRRLLERLHLIPFDAGPTGRIL